MNTAVYLDEFRPFRRGEIALARRVLESPTFLHPQHLDLLRYALRLAQLSTVGDDPGDLIDRIGSIRLRMLQLLAPVLPTDPAQIDPERLDARLPKVASLVESARRRILDAELISEPGLDALVADKRLALVLGGAAGSGYVFLGALQRLHEIGIEPAYLSGCSVGSVLAVVRARHAGFDLEELFDDVRRLRENGVFQRPDLTARYGVPAALRLDLRRALGDLFASPDGHQRTLGEMPIPVDVLATGLGPGALGGSTQEFAERVGIARVDVDIHNVGELAEMRFSSLSRIVAALVSLAMSRRVLAPVFLGSDPESAALPALDGAGFSAAIPGILQYEPPADDAASRAVLDPLFERLGLVGLVDGALASLIPARYAWTSIEAGRIGTRNTVILALDAVAKPRGVNLPLAPILRTISATADRDRAFWDLHVNFRNAPAFMDLFPTADRLQRIARNGEREFGEMAELLRVLLAPLPAWKELAGSVEAA